MVNWNNKFFWKKNLGGQPCPLCSVHCSPSPTCLFPCLLQIYNQVYPVCRKLQDVSILADSSYLRNLMYFQLIKRKAEGGFSGKKAVIFCQGSDTLDLPHVIFYCWLTFQQTFWQSHQFSVIFNHRITHLPDVTCALGTILQYMCIYVFRPAEYILHVLYMCVRVHS